MPEQIGPHLLGRVPNKPDARDYSAKKLHKMLGHKEDLPDLVRREAIQASLYQLICRWVTRHRKPIPSETAPAWEDLIQLDQGETNHCVGFGWAAFLATAPVEDKETNADGDAIYYSAKVIDGEPRQENGSQVRSGAKAMQDRKRITAYGFATTMAEIDEWINFHGPIVMGTNWYSGMFSPDSNGLVKLTGKIEGGHCYLMIDKIDIEDCYLFKNSWGSWGLNGNFKIKTADVARLLSEQGDACLAAELPY